MKDVEKAYKLVTDKDFKMKRFARRTGISYERLYYYRKHGILALEKAQYRIVEQLASVYDQLQATKLNKDNK